MLMEHQYNHATNNREPMTPFCSYVSYTAPAIDIDRLEFPQAIAHIVGVRKETINFWKKRGCPFHGRKTTIRWVRDFIAREAGVLAHA